MYTHIHVKKIKETETGGKPTFLDDPIKCRKYYNSFLVNDINPIKDKPVTEKPLPLNTDFDRSVEHARENMEEDDLTDIIPF